MTATLFPSGFGEIEVRFGPVRPSHSVYVRRRLLVGLVLAALVVLIGLGMHNVLADRGGVPASAPAVRPASAPVAAPAPASAVSPAVSPAVSYVVQPGDTMWSLAERFHGGHSMSSYVDSLVSANGGATLRAGQSLILP